MMEKCPRCQKVSLEYNPARSERRCLWYSCGYVELANGAVKAQKAAGGVTSGNRQHSEHSASVSAGRQQRAYKM